MTLLAMGLCACTYYATWPSPDTPPLSCGNDVIESPEECDGSDLGEQSCKDVPVPGREWQTFYRGKLGCGANCLNFDVSRCNGYCGDGVIDDDAPDVPEVCDSRNLRGLTCRDFVRADGVPFLGGTLRCAPSCRDVDVSGCSVACGDGVCGDGENCANCPSDCTCGIFGDCNPDGYCECIIPNAVVNCASRCNAADRMYANCNTCGGPGCEEVPTAPFDMRWRQFLPNFPTFYSICVPGGTCMVKSGNLFFPDGCEPWFETNHTTPDGSLCYSDMHECTQLFIDDLERKGLWPTGRARFGGDAIHLIDLDFLVCE